MPWKAHTPEEIAQGAARICEVFKSSLEGPQPPSQPFFIGRNGTIEIEVLYFYITRRIGQEEPTPYPENLKFLIQRNAGVFPGVDTNLDMWCDEYLKAVTELTGTAAGWYQPAYFAETGILEKWAPATCFKTPLRSLEPYYHAPELRWTQHLTGKRVTVVSSFADSMRRQVESGALARVWRGERAGLLDASGVQWSFVRTGYAPSVALGKAGWPPGVTSWMTAILYMLEEVLKTDPEVVLIGCGGLGMILGGFLKKKGISSIVLGGAIQVLFGIKGARWAKHDVISKFWNSAWVWPAADEIPGGAQFIEGGCYWGSGV